MLISRESDYALRIIRVLSRGGVKPVAQICAIEGIPVQFTYKILKKLCKAGVVRSVRGMAGGYILIADPAKVTILDVINCVDGEIALNQCLVENSLCPRNETDNPCKVHNEIFRIQEVLKGELKKTPLAKLV